jgi:hypothetical protein
VQPAPPVIVRIIGPPTDAVSLGDVILQAMGLTGVITLVAVLLGLLLGGLFIFIRVRRPGNAFNGETSGELSLHLGDGSGP